MRHKKPQHNEKTTKGEKKMRAKGHHSREAWELMKRLYDYTCPCCGRREPEITLTRDHIIPKNDGGQSWIENIQPLCEQCNVDKGSGTHEYFAPPILQSSTKLLIEH